MNQHRYYHRLNNNVHPYHHYQHHHQAGVVVDFGLGQQQQPKQRIVVSTPNSFFYSSSSSLSASSTTTTMRNSNTSSVSDGSVAASQRPPHAPHVQVAAVVLPDLHNDNDYNNGSMVGSARNSSSNHQNASLSSSSQQRWLSSSTSRLHQYHVVAAQQHSFTTPSRCVPSPNDAGSQFSVVLPESAPQRRHAIAGVADFVGSGAGRRGNAVLEANTMNANVGVGSGASTHRAPMNDTDASTITGHPVVIADQQGENNTSENNISNDNNKNNNGHGVASSQPHATATSTTGTAAVTTPTATPNGNMAPKRARKGRAKTEMCQYYSRDEVCPFQDMCSYAHGYSELRSARLRDVVQDLEEAYDFRCRPCQTFVSTGSCPYHSRCHFLHDPRVAGPVDSKLSCKDMPTRQLSYSSVVVHGDNNAKNNQEAAAASSTTAGTKPKNASKNGGVVAAVSSATTAVVAGSVSRPVSAIDRLYNVRIDELNRGNPFGLPHEIAMSFDSLRDAACNLTIENLKTTLQGKITKVDVMERLVEVVNRATSHRSHHVLSERHRLEMILKMRTSRSNEKTYEFWPTHMLFQKEGCMILQKKTFVIFQLPLLSTSSSSSSSMSRNNSNNSHVVQEISSIGEMMRSGRHLPYQFPYPIVDVYELAFGPEQKKNVLPVSYWFGLTEGVGSVNATSSPGRVAAASAGVQGLVPVPDLQKITTYTQAKRIVDEIKSRNKAGMNNDDDDDTDDDDDEETSVAHAVDGDDDDEGERGVTTPASVPTMASMAIDVPSPLYFTSATPFFELRPKDEATFDLITKMMNHRLHTLSFPYYFNKEMKRIASSTSVMDDQHEEDNFPFYVNGQDADEEHTLYYNPRHGGGRRPNISPECLMQRLLHHGRCASEEETSLRQEYEAHRKYWMEWWAWPRHDDAAIAVSSRQGMPLSTQDMKGPVPSGNVPYDFPTTFSSEEEDDTDINNDGGDYSSKNHLEHLWNSFVDVLKIDSADTTSASEEEKTEDDTSDEEENFNDEDDDDHVNGPRRLSIFQGFTSTSLSSSSSNQETTELGLSSSIPNQSNRLRIFQTLAPFVEDEVPMPHLYHFSKALDPIGPFNVGHKFGSNSNNN